MKGFCAVGAHPAWQARGTRFSSRPRRSAIIACRHALIGMKEACPLCANARRSASPFPAIEARCDDSTSRQHGSQHILEAPRTFDNVIKTFDNQFNYSTFHRSPQTAASNSIFVGTPRWNDMLLSGLSPSALLISPPVLTLLVLLVPEASMNAGKTVFPVGEESSEIHPTHSALRSLARSVVAVLH